MGQKVNPHGLRVGIIKDWDSMWYADKHTYSVYLVQDNKIRNFINNYQLPSDGKNDARKNDKPKTIAKEGLISKIKIERQNNKITVTIDAAKPGVVIGKNGITKELLVNELKKLTNCDVSINVFDIKVKDLDAQLAAANVAEMLENRIAFRRAMKLVMGNAMKAGARGIKTACSGRLGGAEIARCEHYHEGTIPLQTLRANIDYGFAEANTTYGKIGVKVWIYKGDVLPEAKETKEGGAN